MIDFEALMQYAPSWTTLAERELMSEIAKSLPIHSNIVEIGALYGGMTAVLALSAPTAQITVIDDFSWTPEGYPTASKERLLENMKILNISNVSVIDTTSFDAFQHWNKSIDLLWIDGGHSFKYVYYDLFNYSQFAKTIALHDYDNPAWPDIHQAIFEFLRTPQGDSWSLSEICDQIAVLRKK